MKFANSYVNLILIITAAITLVGVIFSNQLVYFLAPEASDEVLSTAAHLSRIMFPMIIFTGLAFCFVGILQSLGEFRIPAVISLVSNLIMVAYLFTLNSVFGIVGLAFAMLIGWASQAFIQVPKLHSLGYRYSPRADLKSPEIKRALTSALPILIGTMDPAGLLPHQHEICVRHRGGARHLRPLLFQQALHYYCRNFHICCDESAFSLYVACKRGGQKGRIAQIHAQLS